LVRSASGRPGRRPARRLAATATGGPEPASTRTGRLRSGFASRLLLAQALVLVAGALTTWLVASAVGPSVIHDHLERAE
jgi:hypothetical protein